MLNNNKYLNLFKSIVENTINIKLKVNCGFSNTKILWDILLLKKCINQIVNIIINIDNNQLKEKLFYQHTKNMKQFFIIWLLKNRY